MILRWYRRNSACADAEAPDRPARGFAAQWANAAGLGADRHSPLA